MKSKKRFTLEPVSGSTLTEEEDAARQQIACNRAHANSDIPQCILALMDLEKELQAASSMFAEWVRIVYELNEDFDERAILATKQLCAAFREVKELYGIEVAKALYNSADIVLSTELLPAAQYLHSGGPVEAVRGLAEVGLFTGNYSQDQMNQVVWFMQSGGAADEVYEALSRQLQGSIVPEAQAQQMS